MGLRDQSSDDGLGKPSGLVHEEGLVRFIEPPWRRRFQESLASERRRQKLVNGFNHFRHLDMRFAERAPNGLRHDELLFSALKKHGAPRLCYVMTGIRDLDKCELQLGDALELVLASKIGTFVSCIPGRLAYFHDEEHGNRHIMHRLD